MQCWRDSKTRFRSYLSASALAGLAAAAAACGSGSSGADGGEVEFSVTEDFLPDYSYDTGYQPEDADAQVRAAATAQGSVTALATGVSDGGELQGVSGSGLLEVSGELALEITANILVTPINEEDIAIETLGYAIPEASIEFDPFLIGDEITLDVDLPPDEILNTPVPGAPAANLVLSVESGELDVTFRGTCARVDEGVAGFKGETETQGYVDLAAEIVVNNPIGDDLEFGPFEIELEIPSLGAELDLGAWNLADGTPAEGVDVCADGANGDGGDNGNGDNGNGDNGNDPGESCRDSSECAAGLECIDGVCDGEAQFSFTWVLVDEGTEVTCQEANAEEIVVLSERDDDSSLFIDEYDCPRDASRNQELTGVLPLGDYTALIEAAGDDQSATDLAIREVSLETHEQIVNLGEVELPVE